MAISNYKTFEMYSIWINESSKSHGKYLWENASKFEIIPEEIELQLGPLHSTSLNSLFSLNSSGSHETIIIDTNVKLILAMK